MALFANAGLPMLFVGWPVLVAALIPITAVEAMWYRRFLKLPGKRAWRGSLKANIRSTFVGLPVAWFIWAALGGVTVGITSSSGLISRELFLESYTVAFLYLVATSAWLLPTPGGSNEVLLLGAGMILMLPAYLVSYLTEARILRSEWTDRNPDQVYRHVWLAHLVTYGLLYLAAGFRFYCATHGRS
jgi:hypothetical protein